METDEEATGDRLEAEIAEANRWRRAHGIPPLGDDTDRADPRLTTDVDFLIPPAPDLAESLRLRGYEVREHAEPGEPPHLLYVRGKGHRIDLLTIETEYQQVAYDRGTSCSGPTSGKCSTDGSSRCAAEENAEPEPASIVLLSRPRWC
ncbi:MAG: hypothetical protein KY469_09280 [Actinobacteria bacterium]|nr:hypothetical protein [Actinomycetota bacterium]